MHADPWRVMYGFMKGNPPPYVWLSKFYSSPLRATDVE